MHVHPQRSLGELAQETTAAVQAGAAFVVVTGGEPLEHDLQPLWDALAAATQAPLHLETSGVGELSGNFSWITVSPKPHKPPGNAVLAACHELKVVVHQASDLIFAEDMATAARKARPAEMPAPQLLVQPGWNCTAGQELAIGFVRSHPQWRLSLQSHKWLGVR